MNDKKTYTFTFKSVDKSVAGSGNGDILYRHLAFLKDDGSYTPFRAAHEIDGCMILQKHSEGTSSAARNSCTEIEIDRPVGTIRNNFRKVLHKPEQNMRAIEILKEDGTWEEIVFIGSTKKDGKWLSVVEINNECVTIGA